MKNKAILFMIFLGASFLMSIFSKQLQNKSKDIIVPQQLVLPKTVDEQQNLQLPKEEFDKRKELLIFLDDSEKDTLGAVSCNLLNALYQEAGPIIASTSLLYSLLEHRVKDNRPSDIIYDEIQKEEAALALSMKIDPNVKRNIRKKHDILVSKIAFQGDRWIIKKINNSLSLLIPLGYLESLNIDKEKVKKDDHAPTATSDIELKLGLRVNHMKTIDYKSMSRPIHTRFLYYLFKNPVVTIPRLANYFINSLDTIFCKKVDYKGRMDIPEWYILIDGHGLINHSIVDLSFYDFKQLLQFLDTKIITKLLVVISCYVAGVNANKMYGEIKLETQQYYSFPIIAQGLNDVVTYAQCPAINFWYANKKMELVPSIDFVEFFKKTKRIENNYSEIMKPITSYIVENTPQIKLPGIEWFSIIDADKKIVSIGSLLTRTRDPQKPLDVVEFFRKNPEIIALYADDIPFELIINSYNMRAIVSMVSSSLRKEDAIRTVYEMKDPSTTPILLKVDNWLRKTGKLMVSMASSRLMPKDPVQGIHRIKKISSKTYDFSQMLYWFKWVESTKGSKWFLIDEMSGYNGVINKDVLIVGMYPDGITVYFKDKENILFTVSLKDNEMKTEKVKSGSYDEKYYNERIRLIRNEYPTLSKKAQEEKQEITHEQVKKIENVLIKQREKQKELASKSSPLIQ